MTGMSRYYLSRVIISAVWGGFFRLAGAPWWMAVLAGAMALAWFLWAPRSGRYVVRPEHGPSALRRDDRTQAIADKAARNAFVVTYLALGGVGLYYGLIAPGSVPIAVVNIVFVLGAAVYFGSDFWLRRT